MYKILTKLRANMVCTSHWSMYKNNIQPLHQETKSQSYRLMLSLDPKRYAIFNSWKRDVCSVHKTWITVLGKELDGIVEDDILF